MNDSDNNTYSYMDYGPDTQPLFIEDEQDRIIERKRHLVTNVEESQSQSLLAPKRNRTDNSESYIKSGPGTGLHNKETQNILEESALPRQNSEQENEKCVRCNKFYSSNNQKDSRNEHYGQLITSELQFVEPCMRTYMYVEILKLIHRYKYKHMPN